MRRRGDKKLHVHIFLRASSNVIVVGRLNTLAETYNLHWVVSRDMKKKKIDQYILLLME